MSNTITFKGTSSTTFPDLTVSELPPIIKPRQRSNQDYIDGRSGIITQKLGYESYPRPAKLSLTSDDDLDDITAWLDGSGDVIFSNEPDKVYKGEILEQIEFVRYGRQWKTAEVSWLVYPYKYLLNEAGTEILLTNTNANVTNAGNVDSLPLINIEATSPTGIYVDDVLICTATMDYTNYLISVDSDEGGLVYHQTTKAKIPGILTGAFPTLTPGAHTIKLVSGGLIKGTIYPRSRFI